MTIDFGPGRRRFAAFLRLIDRKAVALAVVTAGLVVAVSVLRDAAPTESTVTVGFASDVQYAELEPVRALLLQRVESDAFADEMRALGHPVERLEFVATESFEPLAWFELTVEGDTLAQVEAAAGDGGAALVDWANAERERLGVPGQARASLDVLAGPTPASNRDAVGWTIAAAGMVGLFVLFLGAARRTHLLPLMTQADVPLLVQALGVPVSGFDGNWPDDVVTRLRSLTTNPPRVVLLCGDADATDAVRDLAAGSAELASRVVPVESAPMVNGGYATVLAVSEGVSADELERRARRAQLAGLKLSCVVWVPRMAR